jgi:hypothetical protein
MRKCLVAAACALAIAPGVFGQYAGSVISYNAGTGAASGFDQPSSALGEPSRVTNHQFGGPVDPFNPPFLAEQLVSIGAGGSLTLQMAAPIRNDVANPFGLDFIVYGNAGFIFSDFVAGKTDGTLFGADATSTRVSVSADNVTYFTLDTSLAPIFDSYFPTDGQGTFGQPVNPALANAASFNGDTLTEIRAKYAGSAGGTGFDLAWARDGSGNAIALDSINYVRLEVLAGKAEIDGLAAVPEPSTWALLGLGVAAVISKRRRA